MKNNLFMSNNTWYKATTDCRIYH